MTSADPARTYQNFDHFVGLVGGARGWLLGRLATSSPRLFVICATQQSAEEVTEDLLFFVGNASVAALRGWECLPFEPVSPSVEVSASRIAVLLALRDGKIPITVTSIDALSQKVLPPAIFERLSFTLRQGDTIERSKLLSLLDDASFKPVSVVEDVGQFAARGAVVDLYPGTSKHPLRLEFDGSRLTSIRTFDSDTQRSLDTLETISIVPVREISPLHVLQEFGRTSEEIGSAIKERAKEGELTPRETSKFLEELHAGVDYPGREWLEFMIHSQLGSILDYVPEDATLVLVDEPEIRRNLDRHSALAAERFSRLLAENHLLPLVEGVYESADTIFSRFGSRTTLRVDQLTFSEGKRSRKIANFRSKGNTELSTRLKTSVGSGKALDPLVSYLNVRRKKGFDIGFVVGSSTRADRLHSLLLDVGIEAQITTQTGIEWIDSARRLPVVILQGHLSSGFELPVEKLAFVAEHEIFHERSYRGRSPRRMSLKRILNSLANLKEDDFVVHADYGVGVYRGLRHLTIEGVLGDFLQIDYADSKLFLPAQNIARIHKFVAAEGQKPAIDKLSSTRWFRAKQKIRDSVITLAGDLIRLYATRKSQNGWRFEPMGAEDDRFADGFPFDETPDQRKAIHETLNDMASEKAMDRLVCGDVGFGKTEVALRAAFKCTQHARQVAILVPTTILVEQHYSSFSARFQGYPIKVAAVSRFYTAKENQETLVGVASGDIDIVIGTHRLIQSDVIFKDLGLLIIDEEHRFGVKQKERLKHLKTQIDVLTLTATPIPRTLHMSLLGVRDISVITTAPTDRRVVQTFIAERDDALIRDAVLRELKRSGQVFYLHNRVTNIEVLTSRLSELVPEAKFDFAHGQMSENELESIMKRFVEHKFDVLVTTTIVESGLDIPNANTILIDRADTFGLAQLYQLRGRVGRSPRQAFAYLMVGNRKALGPDAQKRLKVLQSLDQLGVGFNLALRDLEIRGAGNLLGKEQSGSVLAVGFDMYCKILEEAVAHLRGEEPLLEDTIDPEVKFVGLDAFIPEPYIPDIGERLGMYQRLANIRSSDEGYNLRAELEDRFGPVSDEVQNLIDLMTYRSLVRSMGVTKAEVSATKISLSFSPLAINEETKGTRANARIDGSRVMDLVRKNPHRFRFSRNLSLVVMRTSTEPPTVSEVSRETVSLWKQICVEKLERSAGSEVSPG